MDIHKYYLLQSQFNQTIDVFTPIYYHPTSEAIQDSVAPVVRTQYFFFFIESDSDILKLVEFLPNIYTKDELYFKYFNRLSRRLECLNAAYNLE